MENQNQPKFQNKKISTRLGIIVIVLLALLVGGVFAWQYQLLLEQESKPP